MIIVIQGCKKDEYTGLLKFDSDFKLSDTISQSQISQDFEIKLNSGMLQIGQSVNTDNFTEIYKLTNSIAVYENPGCTYDFAVWSDGKDEIVVGLELLSAKACFANGISIGCSRYFVEKTFTDYAGEDNFEGVDSQIKTSFKFSNYLSKVAVMATS